jgi:hypothetical protein
MGIKHLQRVSRFRCRTSSELAAGRRSIGQHLVKPPATGGPGSAQAGVFALRPMSAGSVAAEIARTGMERAIDTAQEAWHSAGTAPASERSRGAGRRHLPPPAPPTPQRAAAAARMPGRIAAPPPLQTGPKRRSCVCNGCRSRSGARARPPVGGSDCRRTSAVHDQAPSLPEERRCSACACVRGA